MVLEYLGSMERASLSGYEFSCPSLKFYGYEGSITFAIRVIRCHQVRFQLGPHGCLGQLRDQSGKNAGLVVAV